MPGFFLYRSASTHALADKFVQVVSAPERALPLEQDELVVVQGRGMEQWISRRVASKLGVWAGAQFPFPRGAAASLAARVLGGQPPARVTDDALVLAFAVAAELPALMSSDQGSRIARYVASDSARLLSFAQQAASVLDGYLVFRPDVLEAWSAGKPCGIEGAGDDEAWQAALWHRLLARADAARKRGATALSDIVEFWPRVRRATEELGKVAALPGVSRVNVFAVAGVPPQLAAFFAALGRACDVHWYAVDPAAETAGSPARIVESLGASDLASVSMVVDAAEHARAAGVTVTMEVLRAPGAAQPGSLLARVQKAMREGKDAVTGEAVRDESARSEAPDHSLRVHACPGRIREAEVLHDEILRACDELPELRPDDIVVLVPDIAAYAPAIEAVLRSGRSVAAVPSSVADVSDRDGSPVAAAMATALQIADGDMNVRGVMELIGQPVVAEQLLAGAARSADVERWLAESGASRFLDAAHRVQWGLPASDEGTWDTALQRLHAGLAAPAGSHDAEPNSGVIPSQPFLASPRALSVLGECVAFLRQLRQLAVRPPSRIGDWVREIQGVLRPLSPRVGPGEREARVLSQELDAIADAAAAADMDTMVEFVAVRTLVLQRLGAGRPGRGFLSGGVTVCQFVPMRAVPFRMVCMLGMNDDAFPRATSTPGYSLMSRDVRPGDRDARMEDRALFLESVMCAGERLAIMFSARELSTGTERAPSVVVSELMKAAGGLKAARHPLHAFSVGAFDSTAKEEARVGYDANAHKAAVRLASEEAAMTEAATTGPAFVNLREAQDAEAAGGLMHVTLEEVRAFFRDPAKATLREWGISLPFEDEAAPQHEHIALDDIQEGRLRRRVLDGAMANGGRVEPSAVGRLRQEGLVPQGAVGAALASRIVQDVDDALRRAYPRGVQMRELAVDVDGVQLTGRVPVEDGRVVVAFSGKPNAQREADAWLQQVAFAAACGDAPEGRMIAPYQGAAAAIAPLDAARGMETLRAVLALWRFGRRAPVPFFAEHSKKAMKNLRKLMAPELAAEFARQDASEGRHALRAHARALFRGMEPFTQEFGRVDGFGEVTFLRVAECVFGASVPTGAEEAE